jgi:hypothetical protein
MKSRSPIRRELPSPGYRASHPAAAQPFIPLPRDRDRTRQDPMGGKGRATLGRWNRYDVGAIDGEEPGLKPPRLRGSPCPAESQKPHLHSGRHQTAKGPEGARICFNPMVNFANPTPSRAVNRPSKVDRKVMCAGYGRCLDLAIQRRWTGFTCRKCHAFEPLMLDPSEWFVDSLACIALMYVAEHPISLKQKPRGNIVLKLRRIRSE